MEMVDKDLSEPYSIFTYRFFLVNWPHLCVCAYRKRPKEKKQGKGSDGGSDCSDGRPRGESIEAGGEANSAMTSALSGEEERNRNVWRGPGESEGGPGQGTGGNCWDDDPTYPHAGKELVGVIICKAEREPDRHQQMAYRGYIAMLAVSASCRKRGIGSTLVRMCVQRMRELGCDEAMLETEVTNRSSLSLYHRLGFCRDERMQKYYLNGVDAFRLKRWFG